MKNEHQVLNKRDKQEKHEQNKQISLLKKIKKTQNFHFLKRSEKSDLDLDLGFIKRIFLNKKERIKPSSIFKRIIKKGNDFYLSVAVHGGGRQRTMAMIDGRQEWSTERKGDEGRRENSCFFFLREVKMKKKKLKGCIYRAPKWRCFSLGAQAPKWHRLVLRPMT